MRNRGIGYSLLIQLGSLAGARTLYQLADRSGIPRPTLSGIGNGRTRLQEEQAKRLLAIVPAQARMQASELIEEMKRIPQLGSADPRIEWINGTAELSLWRIWLRPDFDLIAYELRGRASEKGVYPPEARAIARDTLILPLLSCRNFASFGAKVTLTPMGPRSVRFIVQANDDPEYVVIVERFPDGRMGSVVCQH